eukprot:GFKZ01002481.1.p1 GENE.GFKZ01002481.1~~GFKZ01002481.1.p1  ORF type:complete len:464 (-),score=69.49 GFKZ01002481.1:3293-4648(-)
MSILYHALTPAQLTPEQWRARYGVFLDLSTRVLEVTPTFSSLSHHSSLTLNFYFGAITSCLRIPACDLRMTSLSPRERRLALLESSLTHRCKHCVGHSCVLGDVFRGSQYQQAVRRGGVDEFGKERVEGADDVIRRLVREACEIPGGVGDAARRDFVQLFGEKGYDELTSMVAFMGWLNFVMGSLGFPLESRAVPFATLLLKAEGVQFTIDDAVADDGGHQAGRDAVDKVTGKEAAGVGRRVALRVENVARVLRLVPSVVRASARERRMFRGVPTSMRRLDEFAKGVLGCLPCFVRVVEEGVLKRALMFGVREVFVGEGETAWGRAERIALFYVFARKVGNNELVGDAVMMAGAAVGGEGGEWDVGGLAEAEVQRKLGGVYGKVEAREGEGRFFAAARFVYECAGMAESVSEEAQRRLLEGVRDLRSVLDVVGCIGFFGFLHRIVVFRRAK